LTRERSRFKVASAVGTSHHGTHEVADTNKAKGDVCMKAAKCIAAIAIFAALTSPAGLAGQNDDKHHPKQHHYQLIDLGTFGGPSSWLATTNQVTSPGAINQVLNNQGVLVGWGDTSKSDPYAPNCFNNPFDCFLPLAFQWQKGVLTDLGVLPGGDASNAFWISDNGLIAGNSTKGVGDPLVPIQETRAVLWKDGTAIDLGTLGGNESGALSVNKRGQVVGFATNTIPEPFPFSLFGTQSRAFLWRDGAMQDLGTLGSGNDSEAEFVNERGQVAGWSFINTTINPSTGLPTFEPFLWEHGTMLDLGTLGGTMGFPYGLNNRGQVIGISNLTGDLTGHPFIWERGSLIDLGTLGGSYGIAMGINDAGEIVGGATNENDQAFLAFLWKDGVMTNLGTLDGDDCSWAFHINSEGQIVGNSYPCAGGPGHGFIWQNGFMTALNALLPTGSSLTPEGDGAVINDRGEIAEMGLLPNGDVHVFLLIPCDGKHPGIEGCDYSMVDVPDVDRVSPVPLTPHPPALTPRSVRMGMFNRFRFSRSQRNPVAGPAAEQKQEAPANALTDDLLGDHRLSPTCRPPFCKHKGNCAVDSTDRLTGYCSGVLPPYYVCALGRSTQCPKGKRALKPTVVPCEGAPMRIDEDRPCTF
jgi:probable HAF family extracellular repeat protein